MIGRRGLLKALLGAGVASQTMTTADAMNLAGLKPMDMPSTDHIVDSLPFNDDGGVDLWRVSNWLSDEYYASCMDERAIPYHIASKKSWGPAFKAHLAIREKRQKTLIENAIHSRENRPKILKILGIK